MRLIGGPAGVLRVRIAGTAAPGGGVTMRSSSVTLGPPSAPAELRGQVDAVQGTSLEALLRSERGHAVRLRLDITRSGDTVDGTVSGRPVAEVAR